MTTAPKMTRYIVEVTTVEVDPDFPMFSNEVTKAWDLMLWTPEYHDVDAVRIVVRSMATNEVVYTWAA